MKLLPQMDIHFKYSLMSLQMEFYTTTTLVMDFTLRDRISSSSNTTSLTIVPTFRPLNTIQHPFVNYFDMNPIKSSV